MVLAELFLGAFLSVLFDKLTSPEFLQFVCGDGVRSKLKRLTKNLEMIQAVLSDAEEKQLTQNSVKIWLADLRDLAYDVEDLVDEFAAEHLRRKVLVEKNAASSSRMKKLIPARFTRLTPSAVKFDFDMNSNIKAINDRLDELCKQRVSLGLQTIPGGTSSSKATRQQRLTTTSVPTESVIYGREFDKARVLEMVLRDEPTVDANFSVIPIVGMGGLGKTTLARLVYNDKTVKGFDLRAWVCASDEFDVLRISKSILESITLSSCSLTDLNPVQLMLQEQVAGKKFLLVLDDIWSKNYGWWETLKSPLMAGAPGSKIIVTTRLGDVASTMGTTDFYNLGLLSDNDCWSLFLKHAIQSKDIGTSRDLEFFRDRVLEKCKGLPLAAKTLGGLLRSKQRNDEWEQILNSKIWYLSDESGILPLLRLSYYHLPSHLKRCFAYCAILPKDYEFEEEEVVLLWIAEGLVQHSEVNQQIEDLGCEYFRDLLSRSMFQQSSNNQSKFVMHDLINDLAQWVSGHTCFRLEDDFGISRQSKRLDMARHSSYTCGYYDSKEKFEVFHKCEHLRTFLPVILHDSNFYIERHITNVVLSGLLPKLKRLRVLSLRKYYVIELPNSIGGLNHLTYLNLSGTMIRCLPESIDSLLNLQFLILIECPRLMNLPSNMRNLINLCYLVISGKNLIGEMPLGMKELKCLRRLSNFIVGKGIGSGLEDLKSLKFLRGELYISRLENVTDSQEITETLLSNTKNLEVLLLEWGSQFDHPRNEAAEEHLLDMLQPQRNLKELTIKCYSGMIFPSWIGDPSFSKMGVLKLENCRTCIVLPPLGQLSSLKDLTIIGMTGIKRIGSEMHGENNSVLSFQSLESLSFENLPEWEHWDPADENDHVERFPHLRKFSIVKCPKLSERLPSHLSSLEKLVIRDCPELVVSLSSVSLLSELTIDGCKRMECSSPTDLQFLKSMALPNISDYGNWLRHGFPKVVRLQLVSFKGTRQLWQSENSIGKAPQGLHTLTSLRDLCIKDCPSLVSFPDARLFSRLREVEVIDCPALTSFPEGMLPERLKIEGCHSLTFFTNGQIPSSLKKLVIKNCKKLRYVLDDRECSRTSSSPSSSSSVLQFPWSLQYLGIDDCPKLESIAKRFHHNSSLENIWLFRCKDLKFLPEGLHNLSFLKFFFIQFCSSLVSFPRGGLPITNLEVFNITGCEKLKALPNGLHSLKSLKRLIIIQVGTSLSSSPEEDSPTNPTDLATTYQNIYKPLFDWGLHKFTSLRELKISGNPHAESFPDEEIGMSLPNSLIGLSIRDFPKLKYLSSKGFQNLTSLQNLFIYGCPNLTSFPEVGLPSSLLSLNIVNCPLLGKNCKRDTGKEWSKIAHIPAVFVDRRSVYCSEEDNIPFPKRSNFVLR